MGKVIFNTSVSLDRMGPKALGLLREALSAKGLQFRVTKEL
jgi:hypothetical protein